LDFLPRVYQAKLAAPLIDLLSAHQQSIDPNLLQLSEAWQQAEAALQARGLTAAALAAEGRAEGDDEQEEEELKQEAAGDALPEDLQVRGSLTPFLSVARRCIAGLLPAEGTGESSQVPQCTGLEHVGTPHDMEVALGATVCLLWACSVRESRVCRTVA